MILLPMGCGISKVVNHAVLYVYQNAESNIPDERHPSFLNFTTYAQNHEISYVTWGGSTTRTLWDTYRLTGDMNAKKAIFNWWLSQQAQKDG